MIIFRLLVSLLALTFVSPTTSVLGLTKLQGPGRAVPELFFGLHIHNAGNSTPWPPFPVFGWRLWDSDVAWSHLQPHPDEWNFELLDKYVELARDHHAQILLTLGHTPVWAASHPEERSVSGAMGAASDPKDIALWRKYVTKVASRYKGQIRLYEIWNEPNMTGSYTGSVSQMLMLAKEAYDAIKQVDSANVVISPSAARGGKDIQWLDTFLAQGGGKYCDVIGYHFYVTPAQPEQMLNVIQEVKEVLKRHEINKPIWNTESGWAMGKNFADDEERMAYLARAYILVWVSGIERFYWYSYDNYHWVSLPLTLPDHHTLSAAGKAYSTLESWLIGSRVESCSGDSSGLWSCKIIKANGSRAWLFWLSNGVGAKMVKINCCQHANIQYLDGQTEMRNNLDEVRVGPAPILLQNVD